MKFEIHHHPDRDTSERLYRIERLLGKLLEQREIDMATLDDIKNAVAAEKTVEDSVLTLLTSFATQLQQAKNNNDPQAIQGIIDQINANAKAMSDAVAANTAPPSTAPSSSSAPSPTFTPAT